jgi:hypothetical protein
MKKDAAKSGNFNITYVVNGQDTLGRPVVLRDSRAIELQTYPEWMRVVFWVALIVLIAILLIIFFTRKVLPKKIVLERCDYTVGRRQVEGEADVRFSGNSRQGTLTIDPPSSNVPAAQGCGIALDLVAVSPRYVPSDRRSIGIRGITIGDDNITNVRIGGTRIDKTRDGEFVVRGSLQSAESTLPVNVFAKCNHWYLVNLMHVTSVRKNTAVVGPYELEISRRNRTGFLEALTEYMGGNSR